MSTYLDTKTGRWFKTRAELLAFQRGEDKTSPRFVSPEQKNPHTDEVKQEIKKIETPVPETSNSSDKEPDEFDVMIKDALAKPMDEMKDELKERFGVDGRALRFAGEDELKKLYVEKMRDVWLARA